LPRNDVISIVIAKPSPLYLKIYAQKYFAMVAKRHYKDGYFIRSAFKRGIASALL
jgi:hypothetical protein